MGYPTISPSDWDAFAANFTWNPSGITGKDSGDIAVYREGDDAAARQVTLDLGMMGSEAYNTCAHPWQNSGRNPLKIPGGSGQ